MRVVILFASLWASAGTLASPAPAEPAPAASPACALPTAHLHARLSGAIDEDVDWSAAAMECDGMPRADGGFRLRFTGRTAAGELAIVLGIPTLAEGVSSKAVPVNLTLIPAGKFVYGTRGTDKCILDDVQQSALPKTGNHRQWQVDARGFCLEPARAVGGDDAILVTTFELTGLLTWDADESSTH